MKKIDVLIGYIASKGLKEDFISFLNLVKPLSVTSRRRYPEKQICLLCNKPDPDDTKDGIPIHKECWYEWVADPHKGDLIEATKGLHDIQNQLELIRRRYNIDTKRE